MGMDVYGVKNKNAYFRNNVWWWRGLWDYCCEVGDSIITPELAASGHMNDGKGLTQAKAIKLAKLLQAEIDSGRTAEHEAQWNRDKDAIPKETCPRCEGLGKNDGIECFNCKGEGKVSPFATWYQFSVENVQDFVEFLKTCGGFKIW